MARVFVYDGREYPDSDPSKKPEEVRDFLSDLLPDLHNAEIREHKRGEDTIYELVKRVGTKG
jgi:PRTRC genetic system protein C